MKFITLASLILLQVLLLAPTPVPALAPGDLIIVYNRNLPESENLARSYAPKRRVPDEALAAEETGLTGTFFIDARGLPDKPDADA